MGIEVMVVDESHSGIFREDSSNWLHGATNVSEVPMWSVKSMVDNVATRLRRLAGAWWTFSTSPTNISLAMPGANPRIDYLSILDHGSRLSLQFGTDLLSGTTFREFEPKLGQLTPHFERGAVVHLLHCHAGCHEELMRRLAALWGVVVVGSIHEGHWIANGADLNPRNATGAVYVDRHGTILRDGANSYAAQRNSVRVRLLLGFLRP